MIGSTRSEVKLTINANIQHVSNILTTLVEIFCEDENFVSCKGLKSICVYYYCYYHLYSEINSTLMQFILQIQKCGQNYETMRKNK